MVSGKILELIKAEPNDDIWQEAIAISEFIPTEPDVVFELTLRALVTAEHDDTIAALSTCLLEHVLERDFSYFDEIQRRIEDGDDKLLYALSVSWKLGMSKQSENAKRRESFLSDNSERLHRFRRKLRVD